MGNCNDVSSIVVLLDVVYFRMMFDGWSDQSLYLLSYFIGRYYICQCQVEANIKLIISFDILSSILLLCKIRWYVGQHKII